MHNLFRTSAFLAILMLCAAHSSGQKTDTIKVFIMVADTSIERNIYQTHVINGYEVRQVDSVMVVEVDDPNKTTYHGNGVWSSTLMNKHYKDVMKPKYTHVGYLDYRKQPLLKKFYVFSVHPSG